MEKISVIITTFNGETRGFLEEAIESVLNQAYKSFELLIIDDGSQDKTKDFCEKYLKDSRVKYFYQENRGISGARNLGIKKSSGDYICFLDDDDVWLPEKLEKQIKFFNNCTDSKLGMVHTWVEEIDEYGNHIALKKITTSGNILKRLFDEDNVINSASSVMIKKDVFKITGIFKDHMIHVEDIELWFRIAKHFHVYSVNEPLVKYRVHHNNKLCECFEKDVIFSELTYYYALKDVNDVDHNRIYNRIYKKFAGKNFYAKNYFEFRRCCKKARMCGALGFHFGVRYYVSYFPTLITSLRLIKNKLK